jgi:multiple sugar transport system substrate-binding protein
MKRIIALLTTLTLVLVLLVVPAGAKVMARAEKQVTITVGCWGSSPAETELLDNQIKAFEVKNPNIKVVKQVQTGDYNQTMQAKIASKTAPDVYYLDVSLAPMWMKKGLIDPLDKYLDKKDLKDFEPSLLSGYQSGGKTYGLPKDYNTLALFYNKDMFKAANVKVPTTWAELEAAAKKLTNRNVKGLSLANEVSRFAPFILQAGGDINKRDTPVFNSAKAIKGFSFYYSFIKNGYAATPKDLGDGWTGESFSKGHAAMVFEGAWLIPSIKEVAPNLNYGIARLPKGDKEGDLAFTVAYVLNKDAKNKAEAAEVIKFLTGKEALKMTAKSGLAIPSRISMGKEFAANYPERKAVVEMAKVSKVFSFGTYFSKLNDAINKAGEKMWMAKGTGNAKALLDEAVKAALK